MSLLKRLVYMGFGALLAVVIGVAGVAAFAQTDEEVEISPGSEESGDTQELRSPAVTVWRAEGGPGIHMPSDDELLAEALGITVEELQAAYEQARTAAIERAVEEGQLTAEEAEQLQDGVVELPDGDTVVHLHFGFAIDDELLAEALGISEEELAAARDNVRAARLNEMVEAGILTQEEADLMAAREAVHAYVDHEALAAMVQEFYADAVARALADGVITQELADQLLEDPAGVPVPGIPMFRSHRFYPGAGGIDGHLIPHEVGPPSASPADF